MIADEMFENRGFKKIINNISGKIEYRDLDGNYIQFDLGMFTCNCYLGMQELQAINKKVQELGWDK
jgi:hypothetical protein